MQTPDTTGQNGEIFTSNVEKLGHFNDQIQDSLGLGGEHTTENWIEGLLQEERGALVKAALELAQPTDNLPTPDQIIAYMASAGSKLRGARTEVVNPDHFDLAV